MHPLLLPRRPQNCKRSRGAKGNGLNDTVVRELSRSHDRTVCGSRPQAVCPFRVQPGEVVPAFAIVLGWAEEAFGVCRQSSMECQAVEHGTVQCRLA